MAREAQKKVEPALKLYARDPRDARPGPDIGSYESVADLLRRTREQYGEDLRSVAEALRIRYVHLLAIEEGRFRDLPGSTYALGFVRSYAEFLGLDGPEMVERFKEEVAELNRKTQLVFPTPVPEGKVPGGALILISVILLGAAYGAWTYLSRPGATIADLIPPVPEHLQSLSGERAGGPGEAVATGPANGVAGQPSLAPARDAPLGEEQTATLPPAADEAPLGEEQTSADQPAASEAGPESAADGPVDSARAGAAATESPALDGNATADDEAAAPTRALPSLSQGVEQSTPPADEAPLGATVGSAPEAAANPAEEATAPQSPAATIEPAPSPESPAGAAGAEDAQAGEQALAPADHLDSGAESSIPAAPQLASRVPGREPQVYGADNLDARIVLRAHQDSWVQVRDAEDSLLLTRVLRQGDEYRVPNRSGLTLLTGNAGGIEILVDGQRLPPLGPLGSVRRDIVLDPEQLARRGSATE